MSCTVTIERTSVVRREREARRVHERRVAADGRSVAARPPLVHAAGAGGLSGRACGSPAFASAAVRCAATTGSSSTPSNGSRRSIARTYVPIPPGTSCSSCSAISATRRPGSTAFPWSRAASLTRRHLGIAFAEHLERRRRRRRPRELGRPLLAPPRSPDRVGVRRRSGRRWRTRCRRRRRDAPSARVRRALRGATTSSPRSPACPPPSLRAAGCRSPRSATDRRTRARRGRSPRPRRPAGSPTTTTASVSSSVAWRARIASQPTPGLPDERRAARPGGPTRTCSNACSSASTFLRSSRLPTNAAYGLADAERLRARRRQRTAALAERRAGRRDARRGCARPRPAATPRARRRRTSTATMIRFARCTIAGTVWL